MFTPTIAVVAVTAIPKPLLAKDALAQDLWFPSFGTTHQVFHACVVVSDGVVAFTVPFTLVDVGASFT